MNLSLDPQQQAVVDSRVPVTLVSAGPGSGKSHTLCARVKDRAKAHPEKSRVIITYTNAAADILKQRLAGVPVDFIGTLTGFCFQLLQRHGSRIGYKEGAISIVIEDERADLLAAVCRSMGYKLTRKALEEQTTPEAKLCHGELLAQMKRANTVDYKETLYAGLRLLRGSADLRTRFQEVYVDEAQDSALVDWDIYEQLEAEEKVVIGDEDQCQPAGTMIRMSDGTEVPIEKITPGSKVVTYARHEKTTLRTGEVTAVANRPFSGLLYSVTAAGATSRCTGNHKWLIRWTTGKERARNPFWCTYLMRKGDFFRIGKTRFFRGGNENNCVLGPALRMRQEQADSVWVLKIHKTGAEAVAYEEIISANFGLPQACFRACPSSPNYTASIIAEIFAGIPHQIAKASRCLSAHGRDMNHPLFDVRQAKTRRTVQEIHACNLLDGVMSIPISGAYSYKTSRSGWHRISVTYEEFSGLVFSLDVATHHKYVADGLVTCNSIFGFRGARPDCFRYERSMERPILALENNYRSGPEICATASKLISHNSGRWEKKCISKADVEDEVLYRDFDTDRDEARWIAREISSLITQVPYQGYHNFAVLCRTNELRKQIREFLLGHGIPVASESDTDPWEEGWSAGNWRGGVTVSTIHASKGREYDTVFVAGMDEGVLPLLSTKNDIQEERRLAFVAFTRAKRRLLLTSASSRFLYGRKEYAPSRFIAEAL